MKKMAASLSIAALAVGAFAAAHVPSADAAMVPLAQVQAGDLIRGESFPAVYYYGRDGFRYVFPNDRTYFTWYSNFDSVKYISDADLAKIQIGGNVTYKPGVKMIKINTDPKTYAVDAGGTLRWVTTEAAAVALYGSNWNQQIDDVPDAFFPNYRLSDEHITSAGDFNRASVSAAATDVNRDKNLAAPRYVDITANGFGGTVTIPANTAVKFTNTDTANHTATADDLTWGTGTLRPNESFSRYFRNPGTYTFFDSLNPDLKGTIIAQ